MATSIIGVTGYMRSGKDSVADILVRSRGFAKINFADTLKAMAVAIDPLIDGDLQEGIHLAEVVDQIGWEKTKDIYPEARRFLQRLGTEGVRDNLGKDTWINAWKSKVMTVITVPVVASDLRFLNEAEAIREGGGSIWRVLRPGTQTSGHASESELDQIEPDLVIHNDGTLNDLIAQVVNLVSL